MTETNYNLGDQIGVVVQIENDESISFVINNNVKCDIGNIVGLYADHSTFVLAEVSRIELEFYLENSRQYFVSKAVDNSINRISDPNSRPRYAQNLTAKILGYYTLVNEVLSEIKAKINRYTSSAFQKVYLIDFKKIQSVYGLGLSETGPRKSITLGELVFPVVTQSDEGFPLRFDKDIFKKHTLISGITGSGKSRLTALIIKEIACLKAHVHVLDPHDEYFDILNASNKYSVNRINHNNISFSENYVNANMLTKLLPELSVQQELAIFDIFNQYDSQTTSIQKFVEKLIHELISEYSKISNKEAEDIKAELKPFSQKSKNYIEYTGLIIPYFRKELSEYPINKPHVFLAVIAKVNELRVSGLFSALEPSWLKDMKGTIDIFNIDYSSNEYIRRFINSIIQFLLRKKQTGEYRILVIDEAHMLLNENSQTLVLLKQLLREARKFKIAVIFISQNIEDVPEDVITQFQNLFTFRQKKLAMTKFYPDQVCNVTLYGSKLSFAMRVSDIN